MLCEIDRARQANRPGADNGNLGARNAGGAQLARRDIRINRWHVHVRSPL
jgi:hypothetical protein